MNTDYYLEWVPMVTALVAVFALIWQIGREIRSVQRREMEVRRAAKMKIISDLVAHRFVLTTRGKNQGRQEEVLAFNTALSRVPIDFIEHDEVLRRYHELGTAFTAKKYYDLIKAMLEAADHRVPDYFSVELLETVPTKSNG